VSSTVDEAFVSLLDEIFPGVVVDVVVNDDDDDVVVVAAVGVSDWTDAGLSFFLASLL
jgi:hypothetical protein